MRSAPASTSASASTRPKGDGLPRELPVLFESPEDGVIYRHSQLFVLDKHPELKLPTYIQQIREERRAKRRGRRITAKHEPKTRNPVYLNRDQVEEFLRADTSHDETEKRVAKQRPLATQREMEQEDIGEDEEEAEGEDVEQVDDGLDSKKSRFTVGTRILSFRKPDAPKIRLKAAPNQPFFPGVTAENWEDAIEWGENQNWTQGDEDPLIPVIDDPESGSDAEDADEDNDANANFDENAGDANNRDKPARNNGEYFNIGIGNLQRHRVGGASKSANTTSYRISQNKRAEGTINVKWTRSLRPLRVTDESTRTTFDLPASCNRVLTTFRRRKAPINVRPHRGPDKRLLVLPRSSVVEEKRGSEVLDSMSTWGTVIKRTEQLVKDWIASWDPDVRNSVREAALKYEEQLLDADDKDQFLHRRSGPPLATAEILERLGVPKGTEEQQEAFVDHLRFKILSRRLQPGSPLLNSILMHHQANASRHSGYGGPPNACERQQLLAHKLSVCDLVDIARFGVKKVVEWLNQPTEEYSQEEKNRLRADSWLSAEPFEVKAKKRRNKSSGAITASGGSKNKQLALLRPKTSVNRDLRGSLWLESVIWDDRKPPKRPPMTQLIMDLNDPNMIFEEDLPDENDEQDEGQEDDAINRKFITSKDVGIVDKDASDDEDNEDENEDRNAQMLSAAQELDRFNISNDFSDLYKLKKGVQNVVKDESVHHSTPAKQLCPTWFKYKLLPLELAYLHREPIRKGESESYPTKLKIGPPIDCKVEGQGQKWMKKPKQLSAADGPLMLMEYIEQHPPLVSNIGMASLVITYYRKKKVDEELTPPSPELGRLQILNVKDKSPLDMGNVSGGKPVQCLTNKQRMRNKKNLFVLVCKTKSWVIRRLPPCYTVGQTQPKVEVTKPFGVKAKELIKKRVKVYVRRLIQDKKSGMKNKNWWKNRTNELSREIDEKFRTELELGSRLDNTVKDEVRQLDPQEQPNEVIYEGICSPEDVCIYQAMAAGYQRLKAAGILDISHPLPKSVEKFVELVKSIEKLRAKIISRGKDESGTFDQKRPLALTSLTKNEGESGVRAPALLFMDGVFDVDAIAKYIREELELSPWQITKAFRQFVDKKKDLDMNGVGNPMKQGQGVSFTTAFAADQEELEDDEGKKQQTLIKETVGKGLTGTERDLRSLPMYKLLAILEELGQNRAQAEKLLRWERVRKIKGLATQKVLNRQDVARWRKYARIDKKSTNQRRQHHHNEVGKVFAEHVEVLKRGGDTGEQPDYILPRANSLEHQKSMIETFLETGAGDEFEDSDPFSDDEQNLPTTASKRTSLDGSSSLNLLESSLSMDIDEKETPLAPGEVFVDAIKETRWRYDREKKIWKSKVVIVKDQRYVGAFIKDLDEGNEEHTHLREFCKILKDQRKEPQCLFDWTIRPTRPSYSSSVNPRTSRSRPGSSTKIVSSGNNGLKFKFNVKSSGSKRKSMHVSDDEDNFEGDVHISKTSRRKRGDPYIKMDTCLGAVLKAMRAEDRRRWFAEPVDSKVYPDYDVKVSKKMDFRTMERKLKKKQYHTRKDFLNDAKQIFLNSETFNGKESELTRLADKVYKKAQELVSTKEQDLNDIEEDIVLARMSEAMVHVVQKMKGVGGSNAFHNPVSRKVAGYYSMIKRPMDLGKIEDKAKNRQYAHPKEFWEDVELIESNCQHFNGPDHNLTKIAKGILNVGREEKKLVLDNLPIPRDEARPAKRQRTGTGSRSSRKKTPRRTPKNRTPRRTPKNRTPRRTPKRTPTRSATPKRRSRQATPQRMTENDGTDVNGNQGVQSPINIL
eukprot:CAMPEP_0114507924 /NCGR_PEP_ID=MMETSP0109-20121206/12297_1 /TAXON_ID=29199 /ORGANISM="Chlorarachnion reptans, Strain CCCM449" /LENGTH=1803 /DNA_ID=CAMNT_0001686765 /DNA_START=82 /DNA_END=5494 /DNA_ORIENTATION=+